MNCKQGDLAIVVNSSSFQGAQHIGKIVTCVTAYDHDSWLCDPPLLSTCGRMIAWLDCHLRPIRDPGDDAQDETLQWLDVPSKIEA
jgi:hypothetical protein